MRPEHYSASAEAQIRDLPPHPIYEIYERFGLPYCLQLQVGVFYRKDGSSRFIKNAGKFTPACMASRFKRH